MVFRRALRLMKHIGLRTPWVGDHLHKKWQKEGVSFKERLLEKTGPEYVQAHQTPGDRFKHALAEEPTFNAFIDVLEHHVAEGVLSLSDARALFQNIYWNHVASPVYDWKRSEKPQERESYQRLDKTILRPRDSRLPRPSISDIIGKHLFPQKGKETIVCGKAWYKRTYEIEFLGNGDCRIIVAKVK
jgi:hypothetical protein